MAKVHKVSMFVTDIDGDSNLKDLIVHGLSRYDLFPEFIEVKSSEEFEWEDDLEINDVECTKDKFEKYFT
jgi:hypothetical protein